MQLALEGLACLSRVGEQLQAPNTGEDEIRSILAASLPDIDLGDVAAGLRGPDAGFWEGLQAGGARLANLSRALCCVITFGQAAQATEAVDLTFSLVAIPECPVSCWLVGGRGRLGGCRGASRSLRTMRTRGTAALQLPFPLGCCQVRGLMDRVLCSAYLAWVRGALSALEAAGREASAPGAGKPGRRVPSQDVGDMDWDAAEGGQRPEDADQTGLRASSVALAHSLAAFGRMLGSTGFADLPDVVQDLTNTLVEVGRLAFRAEGCGTALVLTPAPRRMPS